MDLKPFWIKIAIKALQMMSSRQFVEDVQSIVKSLISTNDPGMVKREKALYRLRKVYKAYASWLLGAAIELVLGYLKTVHPNYFRR